MSKSNSLCMTLAASLLFCPTAHAQLFRAYLAPNGSDANPCTLQAPCRLLPAALNAVANGGQIWMQGSANYNTETVTIGKSVSILAVPGVVGSIVAQNGGPAISITAAGLEIALRNVVIGPVAGVAPGTHGVLMTGNSLLTIESSLIANLPQDGVRISGAGEAKIANTTLRNNGTWAIQLLDGATVDVSASQMLENGSGGVRAGGTSGTTTASVSDSIIIGGFGGVRAAAEVAAAKAIVSVTRSTILHTSYALDTVNSGTNTVSAGGNLIAYNSNAWYRTPSGVATVYTAGNNQFNANAGSFGTMTPLALQ